MRKRASRHTGFRLIFLGTRGEIDARSRLHRRHSSLLVRHGRARIMIDCGADWLTHVHRLKPDAIVLTHAHPDHAFGLARGAPCPVFAARQTWKTLPDYPLRERRTIPLRKSVTIGGVRFEAFPVEHSTRAPAVGYRVSVRGAAFFYVPDVVAIRNRRSALRGTDIYIGDGATVRRPLVRKRGHALIGHTTIRAQLGWCHKERVPVAIFTHCGTEIVTGNRQRIDRAVRELGAACGVKASVAHDGRTLRLPRTEPETRRPRKRVHRRAGVSRTGGRG